MKCAKCGAEIRPGCVYCSNCGQEAQIVTEINILEDDLLRSMLDEESEKTKETVSAEDKSRKSSESSDTKQVERGRQQKKSGQQKKKQLRMLIILLIVLAAACLTAGGILRYQRTNSAAYQLKRAQEAFDQKNYTSALDYVNRALQLEDSSEDALLLQGQIYQMMKEDDQAETILLKVIDQNPDCTEAYESLLELYDENGSYEQILALKEKTTNPDILSLFDTYLVETPVIDVKSGTYKEFQEVKLSVKGKSLEIYYTLDGSIPTKKDTLYEDVVSIEKQGKTTLTAVAMDKNGRYSEPVSAQYDIELDAPDVPVVSPDGGRFTEASSVIVTVPKGVTVYYTWNDTAPSKKSSKYTGPIEIPEGNNILSLIAVDENGLSSEVLKCNYIYYPLKENQAQAENTITAPEE